LYEAQQRCVIHSGTLNPSSALALNNLALPLLRCPLAQTGSLCSPPVFLYNFLQGSTLRQLTIVLTAIAGSIWAMHASWSDKKNIEVGVACAHAASTAAAGTAAGAAGGKVQQAVAQQQAYQGQQHRSSATRRRAAAGVKV
jgi:hypothetical protein